MKILIAEDTEDARILLEMTLASQGHEVMSSTNGIEALNLARSNPPDLIISDIMMPEMDGFELCRQIKTDPDLKKIPFIFYTVTYTEPHDKELAKLLGGARFLIKPLEPQELMKNIDEILAEHEVATQPISEEPLKPKVELDAMYSRSVGRKLDKKIEELEEEREALRESEEKFHSINTVAQDAVLVIDNEGLIDYWNPAAEHIFGYSSQEALGQDLHGLLVPECFHADIHRGFTHFCGTGEGPIIGKTLELAARHKDGREFPIELSVSALKLKGKWHAVGVVRDITERKRAEDEEKRLIRDLGERVKELTLLHDTATILQNESLTIPEILKEIAVNLPDAWRYPECAEGRITYDDDRFETPGFSETQWGQKAGFATPDGKNCTIEVVYLEERPLEVEGPFLAEERNLINSITQMIHESVDRKQAEQALRESEKRIRQVVETVPDILYTALPPNFNATYISPAIERLLGFTPEQWLADPESWVKQIHDEDREQVLPTIGEAYEKKEDFVSEYRLWHKDGKTFRWFEDRASWESDSEGNAIALQGIMTDITERKQAEETLQHLNRTLRTLSRGNEVLVHANTEDELLRNICQVMVDEGGYRMAWIGYAMHDQRKTVKIVSQAGDESGYLEWVALTCSDDGDQGPTGMAIRNGRPSILRNVQEGVDAEPWRRELVALGVASFIALPLQLAGEIMGVITIYAVEPDAFDDNEVRLLTELADDLSYGIASQRNEKKLHKTLVDTIQAIALTVEKRDPYTAGHQRRVAELAVAIAKEMGLESEQIEGIQLGGIIHDIGKIYVPAEILNRPGKLSHAELEIIKTHPEVGYDIIKDIEFPWPVVDMVRQHHERIDGSGYPKGLKGDEISLEARILAVADVVEAINSHRPYRPALGIDIAFMEIRENRGRLYDAEVVDTCIKLFENEIFSWQA